MRVALVAVIADHPVMCKLCGFADHSHKVAPCTKCKVPHDKLFTDESLRNEFPPRDGEEHRRLCFQYRDLQTLEKKEEFFAAKGAQWTELARLMYFDLVRFTVIDPMHNLLLGVAKTQWYSRWIQTGSLRGNTKAFTRELNVVHEFLESFECPPWAGHLPLRVGEPAGGSLTADEYKFAVTGPWAVVIPIGKPNLRLRTINVHIRLVLRLMNLLVRTTSGELELSQAGLKNEAVSVCLERVRDSNVPRREDVVSGGLEVQHTPRVGVCEVQVRIPDHLAIRVEVGPTDTALLIKLARQPPELVEAGGYNHRQLLAVNQSFLVAGVAVDDAAVVQAGVVLAVRVGEPDPAIVEALEVGVQHVELAEAVRQAAAVRFVFEVPEAETSGGGGDAHGGNTRGGRGKLSKTLTAFIIPEVEHR
ncbi:hypothetical protein B0H17DRAFT_1286173 [Mycena rosella]|uniref:Uncharacterized protein n=1 Tax=Mycena rosella TaxID=1033263 RepID=A0AAD7BP69_MYCRO|nr:hypothetical protein B0H17DRAFT_1286173 [Mycena rosella]